MNAPLSTQTLLPYFGVFFNTTNEQSFFLALLFAIQLKDGEVEMSDLSCHLDCNPVKILKYSDELDALQERKIIIKKQSGVKKYFKHKGETAVYLLNEKIVEAVIKNHSMPELKNEKFRDVYEVLEAMNDITGQKENNELTSKELSEQFKELVQNNKHFPLLRNIDELRLSVTDNFIYLRLIWESLLGKDSVDIGDAAELIMDASSKRIKYVQMALAGENELVRQGLANLEEGLFAGDAELKLTTRSREMLKASGMRIFAKNKVNGLIVKPSGIPKKKLFYNKEDTKQLRMFEDMLNETKFNDLRERLARKQLPAGVTAIFHGAPGTGKTETVMQVARSTGRKIMRVDISETKSMWFGQSEKQVKRIFSDYKVFMEECDKIPILLFNEADAIFSRRKKIGTSNVAQTENAIQNIILEEMEGFEGILVATTNLTENLDAAFERRFLFKILFHKPDVTVKAKIWKLKLSTLSMDDCRRLASSFDFSGGQIDNVIRKNEIREVVYGLPLDINTLTAFCKEESLSKDAALARIGFVRN